MKAAIIKGVAAITVVAILIGLYNMEFVQKWFFDKKADILGTDRTVTFYSKINGTKVASFTDTDMRIDTETAGALSLWLGEKKAKVTSNMDYIMVDSNANKIIGSK